MAIEDSLERIASSLEKLASTQEENLVVNRTFRDFLMEKKAVKVEAALTEAHVEAASMDSAELPNGLTWNGPKPEAPAPAAPEMTFDELKAALAARGHVYPKGTKATTLRKEWEKYKDTAPADVTTSENVAAMQPLPPQGVPASEDPADLFDKPADPFGLPASAPAPEQKPAMTKDEAAARIRAHYQATEEDRKAFIEALAAAGVPAGGSFQDVEAGKFDILVETYERIKGVANA